MPWDKIPAGDGAAVHRKEGLQCRYVSATHVPTAINSLRVTVSCRVLLAQSSFTSRTFGVNSPLT